ncbi:MAG: penicillin-binding protein [Bifidobacteriaceae bacterium]|jgi:membrane peptidoglycan carboxypeptidase|nr:penicillin-binding protein [Bifidobacteriaceae bacterium]
MRVFRLGGKWMVGLAGFLVVSVACGILASALFIPVIAASSVAADTGTKALEAVPAELEIPKLSEKSYIYAADGTLLATFYDQNRVIVELKDISPAMQNAVIALEDRRFWTHSGVDVQGMARAFINNSVDGEVQGASTLTQQFVKNSLIQQAALEGDQAAIAAATDHSYGRKLREAKMAVELEKTVGKEKVLEGYLNIAQFGPSLYGVEAAANYYFGVTAAELTAVQAATIAAVTQTPNGLDPENYPAENKPRRDAALAAMLRDKYITQAEYDEAVATDVTESLNITQPGSSCEAADAVVRSGFFCDYVVAEIRESAAFGETPEERNALLQRSGLHIYTTIDLTWQQAAIDAIEDTVPTGDESGVAQALTAVEPGTGKIKAMAENRYYTIGTTDDATWTAINYNADLKYGGSSGFQPGSTFKPFVLATWLNAGHALRETFDGSKTTYQPNDPWAAKCLEGGQLRLDKPWNIRGGAAKNNTALAATTRSMNASYAAMEKKLDLCDVRDMAAALGVTSSGEKEWEVLPAQVLGINIVSPLAMAGAYATFASGGIYCRPTAIESVKDADGNDIALPDDRCQRVLDEGVANAVSYALKTVVTGGTGTAARLAGGREAAGKTGTTDDSYAAWFCGYTKQLAVAIWAGYPGEQKVLKGKIGGRNYWGGAFGGQLSAPVFKSFMDSAMDGLEKLSFDDPPTTLLYGKRIRVPSVLGMDPKSAKKKLEAEGFRFELSDETAYSDRYQAGTIAEQDPSGSGYGGATVTVKLSAGPPPSSEPPPDEGGG